MVGPQRKRAALGVTGGRRHCPGEQVVLNAGDDVILGGSALEYNPEAGATKFLMGTEQVKPRPPLSPWARALSVVPSTAAFFFRRSDVRSKKHTNFTQMKQMTLTCAFSPRALRRAR